MIFLETHVFTRQVLEAMDDESYRGLQSHLAAHPESGDLIRGSGGLRKIRWSGSGREKLDVSQATFASLLGVSVNTVQNWEQGRRTPTGPARALLNVVWHKPGILSEPWFVEKGRHGAHASSLALG